MPRRPHVLSSREVLRIVGEHFGIVAFLFVGLVLSAFWREDDRASLLDLGAWTDPMLLTTSLASFADRFQPNLLEHLAWNSAVAIVLQYAMFLHGLYDRQPVRRPRLRFLRLTQSAVVAALFVSVVFYVVRPLDIAGRIAAVVGGSLAVFALWSWRTARSVLVPGRAERLLLVGSGPVVNELLTAVGAGVTGGRYEVIGRVGDATQGDQYPLPYLGDWAVLSSVLGDNGVDTALLASSPPGAADLEALVSARLSGTGVGSAREFAEAITGEVLEADPGAEFLTDGTTRAYGAVSRLLDLVLSIVFLVLLSPVFVLVAGAILLSSGRPFLFCQERIGRGGLPYQCWKFRTMRANAEDDGPAWSPRADPRITGLGRFLRRWRIDELPQLVNVVRGDMAFVGPRPEQPFFVDRLCGQLPHYSLRHLVRPGITGWAQVKHPYGASDEDARRKLRFDLFYIKHRSPYMDLAILFDTVRVVLDGHGR